MESTVYRVDARSYLERGQGRLGDDTHEALFYAAFELRCGIEARLQEYLDVQKDISEKKKNGWQIERLARNLEQVFRTGDKIIAVELWHRDRQCQLGVLYYTPVGKGLRKAGQKLGKLLHAMRVHRTSDHSYWTETRQILDGVAVNLDVATSGTLLGPPIRRSGTDQMSFATAGDGDGIIAKVQELMENREALWMKVEYLDELPETGRLNGRTHR